MFETESRKAQELALACDSLLHVLKYGNNGKPVPLSKQIETVRKVIFLLPFYRDENFPSFGLFCQAFLNY